MRTLRAAIAEDWSLGDPLAAAQDCTISKLHSLRASWSDYDGEDPRRGPEMAPSHHPLYSPDWGRSESRCSTLLPPGPHL
eukprot:1620181-Rhodomonas_salina.1